tara:strand:- start:374 stop:1501 length:1128 start_codon:yes stop_codon:yes gene_type:complete
VKSQLLPEGFRDSLPELAAKEYKINSIFIELMRKNGYSLVRPPLIEFESSLFFLTNENENDNSFRILDPLSQKMMGIRSDITLQIARLSCGALANYPRPLRLCYSGDVFRVKNNSLNLSRQITQVGSEIIGIEQNLCEKELINLIIEILAKLKIKNFFLSFTMPTLIDAICKDFKLSKKDLEFIKDRFMNKNIYGIKKISRTLENVVTILQSSVGSVSENIKNLKTFKFPKFTQIEINNFIIIMKKIKKVFPKLEIFIDPLEIDESQYHSGIAFKVFSKNLKELFSGGNYKVFNENCIGFSGFLENLVKESNIKTNVGSKIFVAIDSEIDAKSIKKDGYIIVRAIKKLTSKEIRVNAKLHRCDYYFYNNKIIKVE